KRIELVFPHTRTRNSEIFKKKSTRKSTANYQIEPTTNENGDGALMLRGAKQPPSCAASGRSTLSFDPNNWTSVNKAPAPRYYAYYLGTQTVSLPNLTFFAFVLINRSFIPNGVPQCLYLQSGQFDSSQIIFDTSGTELHFLNHLQTRKTLHLLMLKVLFAQFHFDLIEEENQQCPLNQLEKKQTKHLEEREEERRCTNLLGNGGKACVPLRACVSALLCLGLRLRLRSTLGTATSSLACDCSLGRFLLYDRSAAKTSVEGRRSLLRSAIPGRESAISGVEGRRLFSPRRGTDSRVRNGGSCAAIGAGFTAAPAATPAWKGRGLLLQSAWKGRRLRH
ncbi:hypothetical protein GW17_00058605, partial [Ensete ventricosum]